MCAPSYQTADGSAMMYHIIVRNEAFKNGRQVRRYKDRQEAMDAWDEAVDNAIPGDRLELVDADNGRIMSQYNPVGSEWRKI